MSATAVSTTPSRADCADLLRRFGVPETALSTGGLVVRSPINGAEIARLQASSRGDVERVVGEAHAAFLAWRSIPAPRRGELVRLFGDALRAHKAELGRLVSIEAGKILQEGLGEVQEMIDICDFAVGLSRQLYGLTSGTRSAWSALLAPSTFPSPSGRGTPPSRSSAATASSGSRRRRRR